MAGALDAPDDMQRPVLRFLRLVAKRLEGNTDLDLIAEVGEPALGIEHEILAQIGRFTTADKSSEASPSAAARALGEGAVELHAQRIDAEQQCLAPVVERAQVNLNGIVSLDAIALCQRRAR